MTIAWLNGAARSQSRQRAKMSAAFHSRPVVSRTCSSIDAGSRLPRPASTTATITVQCPVARFPPTSVFSLIPGPSSLLHGRRSEGTGLRSGRAGYKPRRQGPGPRSTTVVRTPVHFLGQHSLHVLEASGVALLAGSWLLEWTWVRVDARRRIRSRLGRFVAALIGAVPVAGLLLYLLLRPCDTVLERRCRSWTRQLLGELLDDDAIASPQRRQG